MTNAKDKKWGPSFPEPIDRVIALADDELETYVQERNLGVIVSDCTLEKPALFWTDQNNVYLRINWSLWARVSSSNKEHIAAICRLGLCQVAYSFLNSSGIVTAPVHHVKEIPNFQSMSASALYEFREMPRTDMICEEALDQNSEKTACSLLDFATLIAEKTTYLVLDLATFETRGTDEVPDLGDNKCRTTELWLRRIEPGTFMMGSPETENSRVSYSEEQHKVTIEKPFYIGIFPVTQKQYSMIVHDNPSEYTGPTRPVENVSFDMVRGDYSDGSVMKNDRIAPQSFLGVLRCLTHLSFDLPTEAQWEYACRAGTTTAWNDGSDITDFESCHNLDLLGRYAKNKLKSEAHTQVGSYLPNAWGLYDMHGNVCEWCLDWYKDSMGGIPLYDDDGEIIFIAKHPRSRVLRGGSWDDLACECRSAFRGLCYGEPPNQATSRFGFRLVLNL